MKLQHTHHILYNHCAPQMYKKGDAPHPHPLHPPTLQYSINIFKKNKKTLLLMKNYGKKLIFQKKSIKFVNIFPNSGLNGIFHL